MRRIVLYLITGFLFFSVSAVALEAQLLPAVPMSYCDLVKNPELYDGKQVTIRASYRYGFEWSEIFCLDCRPFGKTWLGIGEIGKRSAKLIKNLPKDEGTVNAVFTGTFQSTNGPFGDGGYRFRFLLKEITEVKIITKSGGDPLKLPDDFRKMLCAH